MTMVAGDDGEFGHSLAPSQPYGCFLKCGRNSTKSTLWMLPCSIGEFAKMDTSDLMNLGQD
jgi:hypothetical protein